MKKWLLVAKSWSLAVAATATFLGGMVVLTSCGGEGGPIGNPGGDGGSVNQQFLALLSPEQRTAKYVGASKCAECHNGGEDETYKHWQQTIHASVKTDCEQCHGPGELHVAGPSEDNILSAPRVTNPVVCGQCHGPAFRDFMLSGHAKLIVDPIEETATNPNVYGRGSRCGVCHGGLMRTEVTEKGIDYGTLTDEQYKELAEEVIDLAPYTATCTTCHDPHKKTGNLSEAGKEVQLRHPVQNSDTTPVAPGSTAASFTTFNHLCAQCHNGRGVNPADARLEASTARPSMHDSNQYNMLMGFGGSEGSGAIIRTTAHSNAPGQCVHCHMPNARHTFTVSFDKGCEPCHTAADAASRTTAAKQEIVGRLYSLRTSMEAWAKAKLGDGNLWNYTSLIVGAAAPDQKLIPIEIKRARHNYYFIVRDASYGPHNVPYSRHLLTVAQQNVEKVLDTKVAPPKVFFEQQLAIVEQDRKVSHMAIE